MKIEVLEPDILVHDVPFENIVCDNRNGNKLFIEFDDKHEVRYKIEFYNYNSLKVTTEDCAQWDIIPETSAHGLMYKLVNSDWLSQLKVNSNYTEPSTRRHGHIMDDMFHYIMGLGDYYVEIIASGYSITKLNNG